ncbi:hypothetical protein DACRYDRAFT_104772 [Dacryopinax primogenitus]|uniref:Arrestin C-terminal-like domain-containing protein n=1 Tax=Dacryopinax primogenitus (strain DJM 731) TaxID=1858805 RepID=M5G9G3_DACPD|nr:uncharacterized protein DACRYDRAFT_104772 [Dacryopinax primogenitus]EJU04880.1 hypothetical protein DACRYDRAFT_104772 [Dacryopinax primogenitus]
MWFHKDASAKSVTYHPELRITFEFETDTVVAGRELCGWLVLQCDAEEGRLALGDVIVQMVGTQDLHLAGISDGEDHLEHFYRKRVFHSRSLPPSGAVDLGVSSRENPPDGFYPAKQGETRFAFCIDLPQWLPASIHFQDGTANISYELHAVASFYFESEHKYLMESQTIQVVQPWSSHVYTKSSLNRFGEDGLHFQVTYSPYVLANKVTEVVVEVENNAKRSVTAVDVSYFLHLTTTPKLFDPTPIEVIHEVQRQRFDTPDNVVHPENIAAMKLSIWVPDLAWGTSGHRQGRKDGLFKVDALMSVSLVTYGTPDLPLVIPIKVVHPAAVPCSPSKGFHVPSEKSSIPPMWEFGSPALKKHERVPANISPQLSQLSSAPNSPIPGYDQDDVGRTPSPEVVSPIPIRSNSASSDGSRAFSEDVRLLEEMVANKTYAVQAASPVKVVSSSPEEHISPIDQSSQHSRDSGRSKAPPLAAILLHKRVQLRHPSRNPGGAQNLQTSNLQRNIIPSNLSSDSKAAPPPRTLVASPVSQSDEEDEDIIVWTPKRAVKPTPVLSNKSYAQSLAI